MHIIHIRTYTYNTHMNIYTYTCNTHIWIYTHIHIIHTCKCNTAFKLHGIWNSPHSTSHVSLYESCLTLWVMSHSMSHVSLYESCLTLNTWDIEFTFFSSKLRQRADQNSIKVSIKVIFYKSIYIDYETDFYRTDFYRKFYKSQFDSLYI